MSKIKIAAMAKLPGEMDDVGASRWGDADFQSCKRNAAGAARNMRVNPTKRASSTAQTKKATHSKPWLEGVALIFCSLSQPLVTER